MHCQDFYIRLFLWNNNKRKIMIILVLNFQNEKDFRKGLRYQKSHYWTRLARFNYSGGTAYPCNSAKFTTQIVFSPQSIHIWETFLFRSCSGIKAIGTQVWLTLKHLLQTESQFEMQRQMWMRKLPDQDKSGMGERSILSKGTHFMQFFSAAFVEMIFGQPTNKFFLVP